MRCRVLLLAGAAGLLFCGAILAATHVHWTDPVIRGWTSGSESYAMQKCMQNGGVLHVVTYLEEDGRRGLTSGDYIVSVVDYRSGDPDPTPTGRTDRNANISGPVHVSGG